MGKLTVTMYHDMANEYHVLHGYTYFFHSQPIIPLFHIKEFTPLSLLWYAYKLARLVYSLLFLLDYASDDI